MRKKTLSGCEAKDKAEGMDGGREGGREEQAWEDVKEKGADIIQMTLTYTAPKRRKKQRLSETFRAEQDQPRKHSSP